MTDSYDRLGDAIMSAIDEILDAGTDLPGGDVVQVTIDIDDNITMIGYVMDSRNVDLFCSKTGDMQ